VLAQRTTDTAATDFDRDNVIKKKPYFLAIIGLIVGVCFLLGIFGPGLVRLLSGLAAPKPDFNGTLQVLISTASIATSTQAATATLEPAATRESAGQPTGHIVFTCQIFKHQSSEQICIMNGDGSGYRRLTMEDGLRHYYPSLAPDGRSVVYSQYREDNVYEIYEMNMADGVAIRLTDRLGALNGPEISPNGKSIAFERWTPAANQDQVWLMDRDGGSPRRAIGGTGWDPTWSPDGSQLLFASDRQGSIQLYMVKADGTGLRRITELPAIRGRSDWSSQNLIATYSGEAWKRELYVMRVDGSGFHQVSPAGGNSQGPSFSPDGAWIAFTAYFDRPGDINGCEIYIMRTDGSGLRRLTNNDYCDYQPRWGP
jgi:TolB protein